MGVTFKVYFAEVANQFSVFDVRGQRFVTVPDQIPIIGNGKKKNFTYTVDEWDDVGKVIFKGTYNSADGSGATAVDEYREVQEGDVLTWPSLSKSAILEERIFEKVISEVRKILPSAQ